MKHDDERFTREMSKDIIKEALKEWLDEKFVTFGKWSAGGLAAIAIVAIVYIWLLSNGYHK